MNARFLTGLVMCAVVALVVLVQPARAVVYPYTFDSLNAGGALLNGQDNWTASGGTSGFKVKTTNDGGAPHYGSGNLVSNYGGTVAYTATRPNDANWSFSLVGVDKFALQFDAMYDYQVGGYYGQGLVGLRNGSTPIFTGGVYMDASHKTLADGTTWVYFLRGQTGSGGSATTTWGNVNDPSGWNNVVVPAGGGGARSNWQFRVLFDLTAYGGEGSYSMYTRKLVDSDPSHWVSGPGAPAWNPVPGLQSVNAYFASKGLDPRAANTFYLETRVRILGFDNLMILTGADSVIDRTYWVGAGTDKLWTTAPNWSSGTPNSRLPGSEVMFGAMSGAQSIARNDNDGLVAAGLHFLSASEGSNSSAYTVIGKAMTVQGPVTNASTNDQVVRMDLTLDGSAAGVFKTTTNNLAVSGVVSNSGTVTKLTKQGAATLVLSGQNTYNVPTNIEAGGALEAIDGVGLGGKNLRLAGGVYQGHGPYDAAFTRGLGTGDGQVQWSDGAGTPTTTGGGFAARWARLTVNLGGSSDPLTWGSTAQFVDSGRNLIFGSNTANNVVEFQNPIDLNAAARTVQVDRGAGGDRAELSGVISGTDPASVLNKTGGGTLVLSAASNTYAGPTNIVAGALEATDSVTAGSAKSLPATNLRLAGGVFQGQGEASFTRTLGTGANDVQWTDGAGTPVSTDGGFSARGGTLTVTLNSGAALTWDSTPQFVAAGKALLFGSNSADSLTKLTNAVDLNSAEREVRVDRGTGGDVAEMSGIISGDANSALKKTGPGTLVLSVANSYGGPTKVSEGALEALDSSYVGSAQGLPTTNLNLAGGVFQGKGATSFTRGPGTGANEVQWTNTGGGFAARGGQLTVNIGGAGTPALLTWASTASFVGNSQALVFGSNSADSTVEFQNPVELNSGVREVRVDAGMGGDLAVMSGAISGDANSSLRKTGTGTLVLTGSNASFFGPTVVVGGALEATDGGGLNAGLTLAGGVFQGHGASPVTFGRPLGAGSAAVQWAGDGGFAARDAKLTVNLGGSDPPAGVTWNSGSFVPNGKALVFGSNSANNEVEFRNPIDLGNAPRVVRVDTGRGGDFATLSGALSGAGGGLVKEGTGTLKLPVANSFTGGLYVNAGTLELNHEDALAVPASTTGQELYVGARATLVVQAGLTKAVQVQSVAVGDGATPAGTLDLTRGQLVVDGTATPVAKVGSLIASGYNLNDPDNPWKGYGITSSAAAAQAERYALGYALNGDFGELAWATWFGREVNNDSVLVRFTYQGDADLNGEVTTDDFDNWKQGYITHLSGWLHGDLDYSGEVTTDDFDLWKQVYVKHYAPLPDGSGGAVRSAAVPEPGVLVLLALAGLGLLAWRRR